MMNYKFLLFASLLCTALFFTSCDNDPVVEIEEEVITTLTYTLTSTSGNTVSMRFQDLDGDGGTAPMIGSGTLEANTTYVGSLELLNESEDPSEDITEEIMEQDEEHQFFFSSTVPGVSISYNDADPMGNPIGLSTTLTTGDAGSGTLTVTLRHEPNKTAEGVSGGDISNAGGETDMEVAFSIDVQ